MSTYFKHTFPCLEEKCSFYTTRAICSILTEMKKNGSCLWIILYSILLIPLSRIINLHILMACKCVTKCVFSILCLVKKIFYLTGIYIFHHHRVVMVNLNVKVKRLFSWHIVASFFTCVLSRSVTILQIETKYNLQTYIQSKTKIINDSKVVTKDREILLLNWMKYVTEQQFYPEDTLSFLYNLKMFHRKYQWTFKQNKTFNNMSRIKGNRCYQN